MSLAGLSILSTWSTLPGYQADLPEPFRASVWDKVLPPVRLLSEVVTPSLPSQTLSQAPGPPSSKFSKLSERCCDSVGLLALSSGGPSVTSRKPFGLGGSESRKLSTHASEICVKSEDKLVS